MFLNNFKFIESCVRPSKDIFFIIFLFNILIYFVHHLSRKWIKKPTELQKFTLKNEHFTLWRKNHWTFYRIKVSIFNVHQKQEIAYLMSPKLTRLYVKKLSAKIWFMSQICPALFDEEHLSLNLCKFSHFIL